MSNAQFMNGSAKSSAKLNERPSAARSANMRAIRSKNTQPEILVRKCLTRLGYRYRLHRRDLPGSPDVAFIGRRKAIFIHGCFWHGHDCPRGSVVPTKNRQFWIAKIGGNRARDLRNEKACVEMGWQILILFECELKDQTALEDRLRSFLEAA